MFLKILFTKTSAAKEDTKPQNNEIAVTKRIYMIKQLIRNYGFGKEINSLNNTIHFSLIEIEINTVDKDI